MSRPIADIDGNVLSPPPKDSDLEALEQLLLFCRRNDFQITGGVRIGSITLGIRDLQQKGGASGVPDVDVWQAAGLDTDGGG